MPLTKLTSVPSLAKPSNLTKLNHTPNAIADFCKSVLQNNSIYGSYEYTKFMKTASLLYDFRSYNQYGNPVIPFTGLPLHQAKFRILPLS
ncbi:hypothetical protein EAI_14043 [Harpegnathos saltator]|uniref:Uncharacterized protein n=1 Tax=Harpegnathos saltator TaxID=610380 RepID=E2BYR4_HARSA|nr:hypothetical protein EAI_14043 [Harpegnathos saltator]